MSRPDLYKRHVLFQPIHHLPFIRHHGTATLEITSQPSYFASLPISMAAQTQITSIFPGSLRLRCAPINGIAEFSYIPPNGGKDTWSDFRVNGKYQIHSLYPESASRNENFFRAFGSNSWLSVGTATEHTNIPKMYREAAQSTSASVASRSLQSSERTQHSPHSRVESTIPGLEERSMMSDRARLTIEDIDRIIESLRAKSSVSRTDATAAEALQAEMAQVTVQREDNTTAVPDHQGTGSSAEE